VTETRRFAAGEVLPPINSSAPFPSTHSNEHLDYIATLLDDIFRIPGTRIRFGLDAIIGWVPGIGDAIAGLASLLIIFAGWKRGAPRITLVRMVANVLLETGIGMIPIVGDVAHVAWKSNRRNFNLLVRERERPHQQKWRDWVFMLVLIIGAVTVCCLPLVLAAYVWRSLR
jgi:hypothetical protein